MSIQASKILICCFIAILLISSGCATLKTDLGASEKEFSVILSFSKENGDVDPVNVNVTMDGKDTIVNRDFSNRGNSRMDTTKAGTVVVQVVSPPPHWEFKLTLAKGIHQIMAASKNGDAGLDVVFTVDKPLWLYLSYWGRNHFQLYISNRQLLSV